MNKKIEVLKMVDNGSTFFLFQEIDGRKPLEFV
jgi:hypothetical protein